MIECLKMQRFTIDYLTGNTGSSYSQSVVSPGAEIHVANHDGLLTSSGSNYLHTSLHLEDVYSIINKDTDHRSNAMLLTSPLVINEDTDHHSNGTLLTSPLVIDSTYESHQLTSLTSPSETSTRSDVTPLSSPSDVQTGMGYHYTMERATPSPDKDSGIESDNSPVSTSNSDTENVSKSLRDLEKRAEKVSKSSSLEKPTHSYIALIAMAILESSDRKLTLGDIYRHIMDNNPYYNNEEKAWRNSIRYNLSINECFIKAGKDECAGKGNLWAIHPACFDDFKKGDFRRRQARRRARRTLKGLGPADSNLTTDTNSVRASSAYQTMTPSYVNYHPYATSGLMQRHQQMTDYAHAYRAHIPMSSSSYYNSFGQYPAPQYTSMGMPSYAQPTYDYSQQYSRVYPGYDVSNTTVNTADKNRLDQNEPKYYQYAAADYVQTHQDSVPSNNKIEIL